MKLIKKITAALLAGTMAATMFLSASAGAASKKMKLISAPITTVDSKAIYVNNMGQGLYQMYNDKRSNICRIDSTAIKNWRSTGKLKAQNIKLDKSIPDGWFKYNGFNFKNNYVLIGKVSENTQTRYDLKYNKSKNSIKSVYSSSNFSGVYSNGNFVEFISSNDPVALKIRIKAPNGKLVKELNYKNYYTAYYTIPVYGGDYSVVYICESYDDYHFNGIGKLMLIDSNGKEKTIYKKKTDSCSAGKNYLLTTENFGDTYKLYSINKGNWYELSSDIAKFSRFYNLKLKYYNLEDFGEQIYGNVAVAKYSCTADETTLYRLVNFKTGKVLSGDYENIYNSYDGGKTFLVETCYEGKYGYINSKGKELAIFDNADPFMGDYAPVIKGGYAYLIDKNMKQVSEKIKVGEDAYVLTLGEELFAYSSDGKLSFFTFKK